MTTALPTNISFGKVRGRFGSPILAAGDADGLPDFVPLSGLEITFTPKPDTILNLGAAPVPVTFLTEKIVCTLDADGYLVGPDGREGVNLIATDDEDLAPTGWTYTVSFGGTQATYKRLATFDISVPTASSRWLTAIAPIQSSAGGSALTEVQAAVIQMGVAVGQAQTAASAATAAAQAATAATASKVDKGAIVLLADEYGAAGNNTADDTTALNTALTAATGKRLQLTAGKTYKHSGVLNVPANTTFDLNGATLNHTTYNANALLVSAGATIRGGTIQSPATWDGTNATWTYAVVYITGNGVTVDGLTLNNVPRVGIAFKDVDDGMAVNCHVTGNYPAASYTGIETVNFGITFDSGSSLSQGNMVFVGNIIKSCVQGIYIGNYQSGLGGRGCVVAGNVFDGCHNHGIYASSGTGHAITGNNFNRCQVAVVIAGKYHVLSGNTMTTPLTGTGDNREIAGISVRDAHGCVVSNNTIKGDALGTGGAIIDVREINGTDVSDNIISNNIIDITGAESIAIRVGSLPATNRNNVVQGNRISISGRTNFGAITFGGVTAAANYGNQVLNNSITVSGPTAGVHLSQQDGVVVHGNNIRLEYDAPSAITLAGVQLLSCANARVEHNNFVVPAAFGTNIAYRAVYEVNAGSNLRVRRNDYRMDTTKLTSATPQVFVTGSGAIVNESDTGVDVQVFTTSGTWTKPQGAVSVRVIVIGSGGSGGSGRCGVAGTVRCGGGGGSGGSLAQVEMPASALTNSIAVTVGAATTGGAAVTTDNTSGNAGTAGGATKFGTYAWATGGLAGAGGTGSAGAGGASVLSQFASGAGGSASTTGLVGNGGAGSGGAAPGGGSGGGITTGDVASNGGAGSSCLGANQSVAVPAGGIAPGGTGTVGPSQPANSGIPGMSGGGGASSTTGAAGAGGAGGLYGAGGGGGGASLNGNASGPGGAGAAGICVVITRF